ncbi:MAG TPA: hypothetical protein VIE88_18205 [Vicinamibacteria bacterium]|jgi:hypothetical protein
MDRIDVFREALKERVCGICFDRNDDGTCGLPEGRVCALEAHLPEIVKAVESVHSFDLTPYVEGIRAQVCPNCSQDEHGRCVFRDNFDCSVDNFLMIVVDTIEDVKKREAEEARL